MRKLTFFLFKQNSLLNKTLCLQGKVTVVDAKEGLESSTCGLRAACSMLQLPPWLLGAKTELLKHWWDVLGSCKCCPFISSLGTTGWDLEPAFGCPRNHHTNRRSRKVKNGDIFLVLSWYQHVSECAMTHWVLSAQFIPLQFPYCFPFFFWAQTEKIMFIISHDLPCFAAYPPLTLKEKANYTELHITIFTHIWPAKWTCDLAFSRLKINY